MTKAFSSSLSVPGLLTIEQVGLCPLGQVQGSSIYRAGWQRMPRMKLRWRAGPRVLETGYVGSGYVGTNVYMPPGAETALQFINEGTWIELEKQTEAYNKTRGLALDRLREAAQRAGANGVVDVRIRRGPFRPLRRGVEFTAIGTAVAGDPAQGVFLTNLSGEELRKLVAAG